MTDTPSTDVREALERVKATAIENGGRLTPGAILDLQGAINALAAIAVPDTGKSEPHGPEGNEGYCRCGTFVGHNGDWSSHQPDTGDPEVWTPTRELRIEAGPVVIAQTRTDPGYMGEPRTFVSDGVTYVSVPDFDLWAVPDTGARGYDGAGMYHLTADEYGAALRRAYEDGLAAVPDTGASLDVAWSAAEAASLGSGMSSGGWVVLAIERTPNEPVEYRAIEQSGQPHEYGPWAITPAAALLALAARLSEPVEP